MKMIVILTSLLLPLQATASTETRINACVQHQAFVPNNSYRDAVRFCTDLTHCHDNPALPRCGWFLPKGGSR